MTKKLIFTQQVLSTITTLAKSIDDAEKILKIWFARGYGSGGQNEITENNLLELKRMGFSSEISVSDLQNIMYLIDSLTKYLKGQDAPKENFTPIILKLREDI